MDDEYFWGWLAMVKKISFIVEGACEKSLVESKMFRAWAASNGIEVGNWAVDAKGGGNLLPKNISALISSCRTQNPDHIVVLTDLESDLNCAAVRARINHPDVSFIGVAVKALEAWYLADWTAIDAWLKSRNPSHTINPVANPEQTVGLPWDEIKSLANAAYGQGPGNKLLFTKNIIEKHGYDISRSAAHANCNSVNDFLQSLLVL